jgi:hypothetical protein
MYGLILIAVLIAMTICFAGSAVGASSCSEAYASCMRFCDTKSGMPNRCRAFCPAEFESCKTTGIWNGKFRQGTDLRRD